MNENELMELESSKQFEEKADRIESTNSDEISLLRDELNVLRQELSRRDEQERAHARMNAELSDFADYFPETELHSIPDEVWERVKNGASLAAAYALFLRKSEREKKKIGDFNANNRRMSAGSLLNGEGERYYSPAEVKKMTPAQVRANYDDIMASMKHWN